MTEAVFTVPLAATFCVVAPIEVQATLPAGVPEAKALNRTKMVVVGTEPEEGVNETDPANPLPDVNETSKSAGAVTTRFAVSPVPATVNDCSAETAPWQEVKGFNVPVVVMLVFETGAFTGPKISKSSIIKPSTA